MADILDLAELEGELAPEILPIDARLSFEADKPLLLKMFERAAAVTPVKEIIQGSAYALIETFEDSADTDMHLRVSATDGEQTIAISRDEVTVRMSGRALVPAKRFVDILKLAPTERIKIEVLGDRALIRSGRAQWTVKTPTGDSLPPLPNVDDVQMWEVPTEAFLRALTVTRKAVAGSYRPTLMQAEVANGHMTSSDGGRLHRQEIEGLQKTLTFTLPAKVMDELAKALRVHEEEQFELGVSESHLSFRFGQDTLIASRLLLAFPNVDSLLLEPAFTNEDALAVHRQELIDVIQRVRVNADQDYASVFLGLVPGKKDENGKVKVSLAVRARDPLGNTAQEMLPCGFKGSLKKARELCINHKYLTDMLSCTDADAVLLRLGADTKTQKYPIFLEDKAAGFSGVIQQMRTDWGK